MKKLRIPALLMLTVFLVASLAACGGATAPAESAASAASAAESAQGSTQQSAGDGQAAAEATAAPATPAPSSVTITLSGDTVTSSDVQKASVEGTVVTVKAPGLYEISGSLTDGQIIVAAGKNDQVELQLSGVDIACSTGAPIYVKSADKVTISTAAGTENTVTDTANYVFAEGEDEPDAAIFSKEDLDFEGEGTLTVTGNYDMAVHGKDDVDVEGGTLVLTAVGDGLKGKDSVEITGGSLTVTAGDDGIQSNNDTEKGDITISGGSVTVDAQADGIKAEHSLTITGGEITVTAQQDGLKAKSTIGGGVLTVSGGSVTVDAQEDAIQSDGELDVTDGIVNIVTRGGSAAAPEHQGDFFGGPPGWFNDFSADDEESVSAKGLKSAYDMTITGGTITIDSYDDSIHADGSVTISGAPEITIQAGDDAIHANETLSIQGGLIRIDKSYEGLEALFIDISDGDIALKSSDDGMNANGDEIFGPGFGGSSRTDTLEDATTYLHISGGKVLVDASGDGLDSNGFLYVEGGEIFVSGPSSSMNGALDYGSASQIDGGTLLVVGASGMDETFGSASTQAALKVVFNTLLPGDSPVELKDSDGNVLISKTFEVEDKYYNSVVFSSPELTVGQTYTLTCGEETVEVEMTDLITSVRQTQAGSPETSTGWGGFGGGPGGFGGPPPGF